MNNEKLEWTIENYSAEKLFIAVDRNGRKYFIDQDIYLEAGSEQDFLIVEYTRPSEPAEGEEKLRELLTRLRNLADMSGLQGHADETEQQILQLFRTRGEGWICDCDVCEGCSPLCGCKYCDMGRTLDAQREIKTKNY